jgi:F-type H+-transporting ATPase subunit b
MSEPNFLGLYSALALFFKWNTIVYLVFRKEHNMDLLFNIPDFVWAIINLIILYLVLRKILFKPVTEFMENRSNSIKQQLEDSREANEKAQELKESYEKMIASVKMDADKIMKEAKIKAQDKYDEIIRQAKADAEALKANAKEEIVTERTLMMENMRSEIINLALEAASKVVEANMDTESNRKLVNEVLNRKSIAISKT